MPVPTTYPGVYIQELPSSSHTITPAPTSIAAFVGYTHPLKTKQSSVTPAPAIQLSSFADYQNNFGGFFDSPGFRTTLAARCSSSSATAAPPPTSSG